MNTGIRILIERMKTNPEEWATMKTRGRGRWEAVHEYWDYFTEEDQNAYKEARNAMLQDEFTERVMKILAGEGDNDGVALNSVSHNDINPVTGKIRMQGRK
jgi:hypothetical protein